jgi:site-specific DNA-methyltransferase (adenine-specific)/adenine-specific DNA-methyltransferase
MPTLDWIGKHAVVTHHQDVPYRLLEPIPDLSLPSPAGRETGREGSTGAEQHPARPEPFDRLGTGEVEGRPSTSSGRTDFFGFDGNLIVHGDNLLALKALLPRYAGQVKCIYIDPPYNTGNEGWVYNDNVNSPEIRKWLHEVVGREGEDLSRHDKWLCMMYPRLVLLKQFLREDGAIFVSIDDNEVAALRLLMDEIFGKRNFIHEIIWKNKYGPGAMTKGFGNVHEYILCYGRSPLRSIEAQLSDQNASAYKGKDEKYALRGGFVTQPLMTRSKDPRPNLVYPVWVFTASCG